MIVSYRTAQAADVPDCIALRGKTRQNAVSVTRLAELGITVETWSASVANGSLPGFVCEADEKMVAYCFGDRTTGEIVVLALLPDFEAQGIGKALLHSVVRALGNAGWKRIFLGCSADSGTRSYGFYRHLGWQSTNQYEANGDEVLEYFCQQTSAA